MDDLLDEATIAIETDPQSREAQSNLDSVRLASLNAIKNHARFNMFQRKGLLFDNEILSASSELLSLSVSIKRLECPADIYTFRTGIKSLLTDLKYKVAKLDYPPSVADKTCFLFAVMLDEQILHSDWGDESGWENQTLVSELFGIKNGGEQFYLVAERALLQPVLLRDLLELIYIMIKLGFRGRYRVEGKELLGILLQRIEEAVFAQDTQTSEDNAHAIPRPHAAQIKKVSRPQRPVRLTRGFLLFAMLLSLTWAGIYYWYNLTTPQKAQAFIQLPQFTDKYYSQANIQEQEFIYTSTPEELGRAPSALSSKTSSPKTATPKTTAPVSNISESVASGNWHVQLATLSTKAASENFLSRYGAVFPNIEVRLWRDKYRVLSHADTREQAREILESAKQSGITDAFITKAK
ncbi:type IVB secretion system protein IcmH/DotU [Vibrio sp. D404a]|uniref:type IVB secretion system protein IcmH/DotU n=1 Tax=unclassified Vibrio TaxID=2614977 RepID=UPI00255445B6|nr:MULTISPECIES: type IVB secretion system protein IcmH/DotU [unclassified Vibrio]MDK9736398.1 type IVB secretion system protein IcmH/DotU [Vibrio sp. D404a]MDK9796020.1 type IVB secretion system protein IcmH/DotU [Vibrio sp. D449a]